MYKEKSFSYLLIAAFVLTLIFITTYCIEEYIPETSLEMRDTLIYKKGSDVPFTGREKAKVKDKIIEYDILNGVKQGKFAIYYENGNTQIKGQLDNNRNVGKWQYFYESGELESEGYFVNDKPDGKWVWYFRSGKLKEEGAFEQGRRISTWKSFDEKGNVLQVKEFSMDDTTSNNADFFDRFKFNNK